MSKTEEYSSVDLAIIQEILFERYSRVVRIEQGDAELHLDSKSKELTSCPAVYWEMENVGFVVFRLGKTSYRSQFFYDTSEQFNTGHGEFTNLAECVRMLYTRAREDHHGSTLGLHRQRPEARRNSLGRRRSEVGWWRTERGRPLGPASTL